MIVEGAKSFHGRLNHSYRSAAGRVHNVFSSDVLRKSITTRIIYKYRYMNSDMITFHFLRLLFHIS